jgi:hypothetical protein
MSWHVNVTGRDASVAVSVNVAVEPRTPTGVIVTSGGVVSGGGVPTVNAWVTGSPVRGTLFVPTTENKYDPDASAVYVFGDVHASFVPATSSLVSWHSNVVPSSSAMNVNVAVVPWTRTR